MPFDTDIFGGCEGLLYCLFSWANSVTEGFFMTLMMIGLAVVIFMATFNFGVNRAFGFSSAVIFLGSLILLQAALIPESVATIMIIVGALGIVAMILIERS